MVKGENGKAHFDVLLFYSKVASKLPIHANVACKEYTGIDSEGNVERVFSLAKFVLSWLRSHMDPFNAECLLFIGSNWDVLPQNLLPTAQDFLVAYEAEYGKSKAGSDPATRQAPATKPADSAPVAIDAEASLS